MDEINDIGNVIANIIDNKGEDKRNFFGILRAQRGATDLYNISGDSLNLLNEAYKSNKIGADEYKEGLRNIIEATGNDLGLNVSLVYLDTSTMPKDSKGSAGSSYILDEKNRKVLIPIDVNKIGDINELFGTLTEEVSHGKDALEGRQDKKVAEDEGNKEKGLESLGRPANDYVKNKLGDGNNTNISLTTDGIDLTNANVGEKVGDHLPMNDIKAAGGYDVVFKIDPSNPLSEEIQAWCEKYLTQERIDQIIDGVLNSATGTYIFIAGGTILIAALTGGSGLVVIGPYLVSSEVAAVGGAAAATVGWARAKYGGDQIKNGLFDEKIVQPKHIIADSPLFRNNKELYYLGESMIGIGAVQAAPYTFPVGQVENMSLHQRVLPYHTNTTNSIVPYKAGNNLPVLYKNQELVTTNKSFTIVPLLSIDGANKVSQVPSKLPYNPVLKLPVKYPIKSESGVTIYKDYAIGLRGGKYVEAGITKDNKIAYRNNGSYYVVGQGDDGFKNVPATDVTTNYLISEPGGRKGSPETKAQINAIIKIAKDEDWKHVAGGDKSEEYLSALNLGNKSTKDSNYIDITLQKVIEGKKVTVRINTVDIYKNGNLTKREAEAARLINLKIIGEGKGNPQLITIPKGQGTGNIEKILKKIEADMEKVTK